MDLTVLTLAEDMALAAVPAAGFALLFNVPRYALIPSAAGGALGHGLRLTLLHAGLHVEWATFVAAMAVSFAGVFWARRLQAYPKVFIVAAIIPMIPGKQAFITMLALFEISRAGFNTDLLATLTVSFLQMFFILAALAVGLAVPGLVWRKPIV